MYFYFVVVQFYSCYEYHQYFVDKVSNNSYINVNVFAVDETSSVPSSKLVPT